MKYTILKPNPRNTGSMAVFEVGEDRNKPLPVLYMKLAKQQGWDTERKLGLFKGAWTKDSENTAIKLSVLEAGEILHTFRTGVPFAAFHKMGNISSQIAFNISGRERKIKVFEDGKAADKTFPLKHVSISVRKDGNSFNILLEKGDQEAITILLNDFISDFMRQDRKEDIKKYSANAKPQSSGESRDEPPF